WFTIRVPGLVDEILPVDVHASADERLAFLEGESPAHLAAGGPQGEESLGPPIPFRVGRLSLDADAVSGRVDRHVGDQLADEARVLVEVARLANQFAAHRRSQLVLRVGWCM